MEVEVSIERGRPEIAIITLRGHAQTDEVAVLRGILDSIEEKKIHRVVINLREATYLPSSMFGLIVSYATNKNSIESAQSVALCSVPASITTVMSLMDVGRYFLIFDNLTSALSAFGGGKFEGYSEVKE
jgi:anti-anti-sigma regulatory factor